MGSNTIKTASILVFFVAGLHVSLANVFTINLQLTGDMDYPGILKMDAGADKKFDRLCFLGQDALGLLDLSFLETLAEKGIPEGDYQVTNALPDEKWPTRSFSPNGALRLSPMPELQSPVFNNTGKTGFAIHAKDFFPLAAKMTQNSKMILFFSDQLFERLMERWGTLRISNWDMGRFHDFFQRNTQTIDQWKVQVEKVPLASVKSICEPLKVQRKPGAAPE